MTIAPAATFQQTYWEIEVDIHLIKILFIPDFSESILGCTIGRDILNDGQPTGERCIIRITGNIRPRPPSGCFYFSVEVSFGSDDKKSGRLEYSPRGDKAFISLNIQP